ncbi:PilN domain-containing protein [Geothrix sp. 21YS21S-2]|uniref:PilN domain-containing protein n=1 Tax=Geothrix sp. 21YS21S-2 TaxID=3068893 RepID=UPI0027B94944|nr:PilN domain-containing protein [Geothrix sp. 21YS21S-2]
MAVPALKLDLAPPSTLWRLNHALIGWAALAAGGLVLAGALGFTLRAYQQASRAGKLTVATNARTRLIEDSQRKVMDELRSVDVAKELPRWRLAERIFTERSLPWSRLTAELERSMVPDVRLKSLQRTRGSDQKVQVKVRGEARTREAEAALVESIQKNPFFEQVILERESDRQGGGVDFEYTLAVFSVPPPYKPLPKYGPQAKASKAAPKAEAPRPAAPAPAAPRPVAPRPAAVEPPARDPYVPTLMNPAVPQNPFPARTPRPPRSRPRPSGGGEE